jgi:hypothetical protein
MAFFTKEYQGKHQGRNVWYFKFLRGPKSKNEFSGLLSELTNFYIKQEEFALIVDSSGCSISPSYVTVLSEWMKNNKLNAQKYLKKTSVIVEGLIVRNFLKAVFFVVPASTPVRFFEDRYSAAEFAGIDMTKLKLIN